MIKPAVRNGTVLNSAGKSTAEANQSSLRKSFDALSLGFLFRDLALKSASKRSSSYGKLAKNEAQKHGFSAEFVQLRLGEDSRPGPPVGNFGVANRLVAIRRSCQRMLFERGPAGLYHATDDRAALSEARVQ